MEFDSGPTTERYLAALTNVQLLVLSLRRFQVVVEEFWVLFLSLSIQISGRKS